MGRELEWIKSSNDVCRGRDAIPKPFVVFKNPPTHPTKEGEALVGPTPARVRGAFF
jgi:hypothetical protein